MWARLEVNLVTRRVVNAPFTLKVPSTLIVCKSNGTDVGALKGGGGVGRCYARRREQTQQQGQRREQADQSDFYTKRQSHMCFSLSAREIMVLMHTLTGSIRWRMLSILHYKNVALSHLWLRAHLPRRGPMKVFCQLLFNYQLPYIILPYDHTAINTQCSASV